MKAIGALLATAWAFWAAPVYAQVSLSLHAPTECANEEQVRKAIRNAENAENIGTLRVEIAPTAEGLWRADVVAQRANEELLGARTVISRSAECHSLDNELAVVISMMAESLFAPHPTDDSATTPAGPDTEASRPTETESPDVLQAPSAPASTPPTTQEDPRRAPGESPYHFRIGPTASAQLGWGMLPGVNYGFTLGAQLILPPMWPIELDARTMFGARAENASGSAQLNWYGGALSICPSLFESRYVALGACGRVQIGAIHSEGTGFTRNQAHTDVTYDAGALARVSLLLAPAFQVQVDLSGMFALEQFQVVYQADDGGIVRLYREPLFHGALGVGATYLFTL